MQELGRTGWFFLGVTAMAMAGVAHAVAGVAHIGRDVIRGSHPAEASSTPGSGNRTQPVDGGSGSWILFSALVMAGGAAHHVIAAAREIIREILAPPAR